MGKKILTKGFEQVIITPQLSILGDDKVISGKKNKLHNPNSIHEWYFISTKLATHSRTPYCSLTLTQFLTKHWKLHPHSLTLKIFRKPLWIFGTDVTIPPPWMWLSWFHPLHIFICVSLEKKTQWVCIYIYICHIQIHNK